MNIYNKASSILFLILCSAYLSLMADKALCAQEITFPNFDQSLMRHGISGRHYEKLYSKKTFDPKLLELRAAKNVLKEIYNQGIRQFNFDETANCRIPKIIHQIWLGGNVPAKFHEWMKSWATMNGWEYKLWTENALVDFPLHNQHLFDNAKDYGEKADILRYEILYRLGGLYVDVDFENINSKLFEGLHRSFDFYAGIEPIEHRQRLASSPLIGNALLGSIPGHPILEKVILDMKDHYAKYYSLWAVVATGPVYLSQKVFEYIQSKDARFVNIFLPPTFFFPITYSEARHHLKENRSLFVKPETAAIHYWAESWVKDEKIKTQ